VAMGFFALLFAHESSGLNLFTLWPIRFAKESLPAIHQAVVNIGAKIASAICPTAETGESATAMTLALFCFAQRTLLHRAGINPAWSTEWALAGFDSWWPHLKTAVPVIACPNQANLGGNYAAGALACAHSPLGDQPSARAPRRPLGHHR
jgi:hypothetical protein